MRNCQQTAAYTATSILTNLKVNVQEHFMQMFLRYVNERLGLKQVKRHLRRAQRRRYYRCVRQFTKYATFEEYPTEEELARLTRLERTILDELWALFPPQIEPLAYSLAVDAMPYLGELCPAPTVSSRASMSAVECACFPLSRCANLESSHLFGQLRDAPNIVSIDLNKRNLLFRRDIKKERLFRYTSNQQAVETKSRYFQRDMRERKINAGIAEMESHIPSHRSMNIEAFSAFIVDYEHADPTLDGFYQDEIHVARRFKAFSLQQKSESKLIKNMRRLYGKHFSVILGDWSDAGKTMRFQESSKTKG
ncbi:uncharacterized protein EV422DRAFT_596745 [Fimicolochytrium jonesii]|uniref:uncharacterized protein n=1 Tax=Fimicolochytrium jonesii TaxID=1396493 RepID=UPI0022FDC1E3|nr:uncharacterized protein EV422DRAFT_596745 [Fimicolochytrium jonesii]KAI8820529.1 hypothetical protein EV422DRAFT_596745 [Fimicolochytrium jonesii]